MLLQQQNIIDKRTRLRWRRARPVYSTTMLNDVLSPDSYFLTSEPILGGQNYYVRLKEGFKVAFIIFYDREKRIRLRSQWNTRNGYTLNYQHDGAPANIRDTVYGVDRKTFVPTWIPTGAYVRVVACRDDVVLEGSSSDSSSVGNNVASGTEIGDVNDPVELFFLADTVQMQRGMEGRPEGYTQRMRLARQVTNVYVRSRVATKNYTTENGGGSFKGNGAENSKMIGVPYAAVSGHHLGVLNLGWLGMETYLSLWGNRRSLVYTELPKFQISEYGLSWTLSDNVSSYGSFAYGMVCNSVPATLFGMPERANETIWGQIASGSLSGMFETVYKNTAAMRADGGAKFRPMDVIYVNGQHVYVLTAVYERGGERWFEMMESSNQCQLFLVTAQMIADRLDYEQEQDSARVYKFVRPKAAFYERVGHFDYKKVAALADEVRHTAQKYEPNDDICTFAGDKATFAQGDAIWLNVRQTNGTTRATFDTIKIYRKAGERYVEETSMAMSQPASSGHRKTFTADGSNDVVWDIDVTSYFADKEGLYEATAYNSVTEAESAPVRFEVIKVEIVAAYSVGSDKMMAILGEGMVKEGRTAFVQAMKSNYTKITSNYANHAHYLVPKGTEGYYGLVLVDVGAGEIGKAALMVKGEYGWAQKCIDKTEARSNYLSIAGGATSVAGAISADTGARVTPSNWHLLVKTLPDSLKGKTVQILFNDVARGSYNIMVAQYTTTDPANFTSSTLVKKQFLRGTKYIDPEPTGETVMADVKIADNAAAIAVSMPNDLVNGLSYVGAMVLMPSSVNLVKAEDVGYDYYVGWIDNAINKDDLEDKTAEWLLAYAKGYMVSETPTYTKTVKAEEAKGKKQMYYILWQDDHAPQSGTKSGEVSDITWVSENFTGDGSDTKAWITYGGKMVTIGDTDYHVACWLESCDAGDILTINF